MAAIRSLLEHGADVNAVQKKTGNTALHYAAMRGADDVVALLVQFGADGSIRNAEGKLPRELEKTPAHAPVTSE